MDAYVYLSVLPETSFHCYYASAYFVIFNTIRMIETLFVSTLLVLDIAAIFYVYYREKIHRLIWKLKQLAINCEKKEIGE